MKNFFLTIKRSFNSAESSIVTIRSSLGMKLESEFKNVVFPEPVPPHINIVLLFLTHSARNLAASSVMKSCLMSDTMSCVIPVNFLMVTVVSLDIGGRTALALEPSGSRKSAIGLASFKGLFWLAKKHDMQVFKDSSSRKERFDL